MLNQCCVIVNWTHRNRLKWTFNKNTKLFIHENAYENIIWEKAAILSWGRWVKQWFRQDCIGLPPLMQEDPLTLPQKIRPASPYGFSSILFIKDVGWVTFATVQCSRTVHIACTCCINGHVMIEAWNYIFICFDVQNISKCLQWFPFL